MHIFGPKNSYNHQKGFYITRPKPHPPAFSKKGLGFMAVLVLLSNFFTYSFTKHEGAENSSGLNGFMASSGPSLYLMDKASTHIYDVRGFESKVTTVAASLNVPPEWLMAVMYSESKAQPCCGKS